MMDIEILEALRIEDVTRLKKQIEAIVIDNTDQLKGKLLFLCYARLINVDATNEGKYLRMLCNFKNVPIGSLFQDIKEAQTGRELAKIFICFLHHRNITEDVSFLSSVLD
jgi:hypothetical protein